MVFDLWPVTNNGVTGASMWKSGMDKKLAEGIAAMERKDYFAAHRILMQLAEQGVAEAQYRIRSMHHRAMGVLRDFKEAAFWYQKAADQGHADAYMGLGSMYSVGEVYGNVLPRDPIQAMRCYQRAAELGAAFANFWIAQAFEIGSEVKQDYDKAAFYYRKAADQGHVNALLCLGSLYSNHQVKKYTKALACYREAIDKCQISAWYHIGFMHLWGEGVEKNAAEAIRCWRKLADRGDCCAQERIGEMYSDGRHMTRDLIEAYKWFSLAAAAGERGECETYNFLYVKHPAPVELTEDFDRHLKSEHTPRNHAHEESSRQRDQLAFSMTPEQLKAAKQLVEEWRPIRSRH